MGYTFEKLFKEFIEWKKYNTKESTVTTYYAYYNAHLKDHFFTIKPNRVKKDDINNFIKKMLNKGYSTQYTMNIIKLLMQIMKFGKEQATIKQVLKPMKFRVEQDEIQTLNDYEQIRLERVLMNEMNISKLMMLISLYTGLRLGELCGLKVENIEQRTLYVNTTIYRVKNQNKNIDSKTVLIATKPKTKESIRYVPIPDFLYNLLKKSIKHLNKKDYLLTGRSDKFFQPRTLENHFKRVLKACSIPDRKFHSLRHTFATNSIIYGWYDLKTLSEILGHNDVKTTLRIYVHTNMKIKNMQVNNVDLFFTERHQLNLR